jgi:hypothetical protein
MSTICSKGALPQQKAKRRKRRPVLFSDASPDGGNFPSWISPDEADMVKIPKSLLDRFIDALAYAA